MAALRDLLVPQSTIVTPNGIEVRRLAQEDADEPEDASTEECAAKLIQLGAEYVLVTGTHVNTPQVINTLYGAQGVVREDKWDRLPGQFHGAGCTLASAIAATLANGLDLARGGARRAGVHVADPRRRLPPGHGAHAPGPFLLGPRRRRGAAAPGRGVTVPGLPRGLYAITPDDADTDRLLARVAAAIAGGAAIVQYRNKAASPALARAQAERLAALCRDAGVPLIVNDDARLACDVDAAGAHLGAR